jgi:NAD(P)-dependent dehydrogenase (short-subunit alcohol dehydrogenase family)
LPSWTPATPSSRRRATPGSIAAAIGEHPNLLALALDVTDEAQAHAAAAAAAVRRFGKIDILVNNAGFGLLGAVEEATAAEIEALYRTNVFGLLRDPRGAAAYAPPARPHPQHLLDRRLSQRTGLRRLLLDQVRGRGPVEALAGELAPLGITATIVEPGYFRTDFLDARSLSVSPARSPTMPRRRRRARTRRRGEPPPAGRPAKLAGALMKMVEQPAICRCACRSAATRSRRSRPRTPSWRQVSVGLSGATAA